MARKRVSYLEKQWTMDQNRVAIFPGAPIEAVLASDPDGTLNTEARLLRVLLSVRWGFKDLDLMQPGLLGVGLTRYDNNLNFTSMNPTLNSSANKRWLYRDIQVTPCTATTFAYTGDIAVLDHSYATRYDWQVHGGKGATLNKDEKFAVLFSAVANYTEAIVQYNILSLWEV